MSNLRIKPRYVGTGTFKVSPRMHEYIDTVLKSGRISYGKFSREFEITFAKLHDCEYGILSNSGTSSLQVALQALKELHGWKDGTEVIVPATTFVATSNIVYHNQMTPVFVDINRETYNIDVDLIKQALTDKTRAIIPVHLFGQSADMGVIRDIADIYNLAIIEDSCETMFASHGNKKVGSWGDIGCFSFYAAHLLVTGVGGMGITNNPDIAAKMRSLVNHGLSVDNLNMDDNFAPRSMLGRRFNFDSRGHSYRLTELEAALGLAQIEDEEDSCWPLLKRRFRNAKHLGAGLRIINGGNFTLNELFVIPKTKRTNTHSWMMYPIVINKDVTEFTKQELTKYLNDHQIETRDMLPILGQPIYKYMRRKQFPVSDWVEKNGFYVGCHQHLDEDDIQYVIQTISNFMDSRR